MRRKIYEKLLKLKRESKGKTALLIDGAHHVGRSSRRYTTTSLIPIYMAPFLVSRNQVDLTKGKWNGNG